MSAYQESKQMLTMKFQEGDIGRPSFTTDLWTSGNQHAILGITMSWLDANFKMNEIVIGHRKIVGEHSGVNIARTFQDVLTEYQVIDKVLTIKCFMNFNANALFSEGLLCNN